MANRIILGLVGLFLTLTAYAGPQIEEWKSTIYSKDRNKVFNFLKLNIINRKKVTNLFKKNKFEKVFHLAAQPGVRFSFEKPYNYIDTNLVGFFNILENCKLSSSKLIFASSSSVYGLEKKNTIY